MKGVPAAVALAASFASYAQPAVEKLVEYINDRQHDDPRNLVTVPELYCKGFPLTADQGIEMLENLGLKAVIIKVPFKEASIAYRNCLALQIIGTHPNAKTKVDPGSSVIVKCVTQEVIDESQRLFEEAEQKKKIQKAERKEKSQQMKSSAMKTVKSGTHKLSSAFHKKPDEKE